MSGGAKCSEAQEEVPSFVRRCHCELTELQENRSEGARKKKIYMDISSADNWILKDGASHIVVVYNVKNKKKRSRRRTGKEISISAEKESKGLHQFDNFGRHYLEPNTCTLKSGE